MNLLKNKYGIAGLVIIAVAAVHYFFFYEPCKELKEQDFRSAQQQCWQDYDKSNLKQFLCQKIEGTDDCMLYQEIHGALVEGLIEQELQPCVDKALKAANFCEKK